LGGGDDAAFAALAAQLRRSSGRVRSLLAPARVGCRLAPVLKEKEMGSALVACPRTGRTT
jgi:hypothetical protein